MSSELFTHTPMHHLHGLQDQEQSEVEATIVPLL